MNWAAREKVRLFEVSALDRSSLNEPLVYLSSKLNPPQSKSSFPQLSMGRSRTTDPSRVKWKWKRQTINNCESKILKIRWKRKKNYNREKYVLSTSKKYVLNNEFKQEWISNSSLTVCILVNWMRTQNRTIYIAHNIEW